MQKKQRSNQIIRLRKVRFFTYDLVFKSLFLDPKCCDDMLRIFFMYQPLIRKTFIQAKLCEKCDFTIIKRIVKKLLHMVWMVVVQ